MPLPLNFGQPGIWQTSLGLSRLQLHIAKTTIPACATVMKDTGSNVQESISCEMAFIKTKQIEVDQQPATAFQQQQDCNCQRQVGEGGLGTTADSFGMVCLLQTLIVQDARGFFSARLAHLDTADNRCAHVMAEHTAY